MKTQLTIKTWAMADAFLTRAKKKILTRKVPNIRSTVLQRLPGGGIAVKYHGTAVVVMYKTGGYLLNSGGYRTSTTKRRINTFSPARVYQRKRVWYLDSGEIFVDGVRIGMLLQRSFTFC